MEKPIGSRIAIVTGSNTGIGAAIVRDLASRGCSVVIHHRSNESRTEAEELAREVPLRCTIVQADLSTVEGPLIVVQAAVKAFGKIDIVINNAALALIAPFEEQTLEDWDRLVNLNARSVFLITQAALQHLTKGSSRIVNVLSLASRVPPPLQTIYAGTKGMVDSFTKVWAKELPPKYGCTVNAVSPGPTRTRALEGALADEEISGMFKPFIDLTPAGSRLGEPEEIAYAVGMLCDEKARWINGVHLFACGGLHVD